MENKKTYLKYVLLAAIPASFGVYLLVRNARKNKSTTRPTLSPTTPPTTTPTSNAPITDIFNKIKNWWEGWDLKSY